MLSLLPLPEAGFLLSDPCPKKSFALDGWVGLDSALTLGDSFASGLGFGATAGMEAGAGGGRRFVRRFTKGLVIVP